MSWSTLEAMQDSTYPSTSMDIDDMQLGWDRLFAANAFLDELYVRADTDAKQQPHNSQVPDEDIDSHVICQECDRRDLTDMDDNTYAGLYMDGLRNRSGSIEAPLKQLKEFDVNISSFDQKTLENILAGYEQDYENRIFQPHAGDLQLQRWQFKSPFCEHGAMTNPSTNSISLPAIRSSSSSYLPSSSEPCQERPASRPSGQQCAVEYESQSQQLHADFFSNNTTETALMNMSDAALADKGVPCFYGFSNGVDVDHRLMPISLQKDPTENLMALVSLARRHGLPAKRRRIERLPKYKKTQPSRHLLSVAFVSPYSDDKEIGPQRDLSHGQIEENVNVRKTRLSVLNRKSITPNVVKQTQVRLITCDHKTGATISAALEYKDDEYCGLADAIPHYLIFTMANMHVADLLTKQLCALLEKEGFELIDDKFQLIPPRDNSFVCSTSSSSLALCNGIQQSDSLAANENGKSDGASMSDLMLAYPVCDNAITESRVGSFPRILQNNFSPGLLTNLGSQLQLAHTQQVQAHLSQFSWTSVQVEAQNRVHEQREQMAWPRRKFILPPAAWGA